MHSSTVKVALEPPPSVVGRQGVIEVLWPEMSNEEMLGLERSAENLRNAVRKFIRLH